MIYFRDPARIEVLQSGYIGRAELLIIAADDPDTNLKIARLAKRHYPELRIIALEHDEHILAEHYLVHDNEAALIASAEEAYRELEALFDADRLDRPDGDQP